MRSCRALSLKTVAVYSEVDPGAARVAGGMRRRRSGRRRPSRVTRRRQYPGGAKASGADAVHPGYGFLAENSGFAKGRRTGRPDLDRPTPESIDDMGGPGQARCWRARRRAVCRAVCRFAAGDSRPRRGGAAWVPAAGEGVGRGGGIGMRGRQAEDLARPSRRRRRCGEVVR